MKGGTMAKVTFKIERNEMDEFVVVVNEDGVRNEGRCYYTDDKDDAQATMVEMEAEEKRNNIKRNSVIEPLKKRTEPKHFEIIRKGGTYFIKGLVQLDPFAEIMEDDDQKVTGPDTGLYLFGMESSCDTIYKVMREIYRVMYDEYQTNPFIKEGDTFTVKAHYRKFWTDGEPGTNRQVKRRIPEMKLRCESFHVLWDNSFELALDDLPNCINGYDSFNHKTKNDLAWLVQLQIDLKDEGEDSEIKTKAQLKQCKAYVEGWMNRKEYIEVYPEEKTCAEAGEWY